MLGAFRRYGVDYALRASTSRGFISKTSPQIRLKWQGTLSGVSPIAVRSLHRSSTLTQESPGPSAVDGEEWPSTFTELDSRRLLGQRIIDNIKNAGIENMTPIQQKAMPAILDGADMYDFLSPLFFFFFFFLMHANLKTKVLTLVLFEATLKRRLEPERH